MHSLQCATKLHPRPWRRRLLHPDFDKTIKDSDFQCFGFEIHIGVCMDGWMDGSLLPLLMGWRKLLQQLHVLSCQSPSKHVQPEDDQEGASEQM